MIYIVYVLILTSCTLKHIISVSNQEPNVEGNTITCLHTIPDRLPNGITNVYILDCSAITLTPQTFNDSSWTVAELLDITVLSEVSKPENVDYLEPHVFQPLRKLLTLGLHSAYIRTIHGEAFYGLTNLQTLNFADCTKLGDDSLKNVLTDHQVLPALDTLLLDNVQTASSHPFVFDNIFSDILYDKGIKHLSLAGSSIIIRNIHAFNKRLQLESFNISHCIVVNVDKDSNYSDLYRALLNNIKTIDISYLFIGDLYVVYTNLDSNNVCNSHSDSTFSNFIGLEHFYANGIYQRIIIDGTTFDLSECNLAWLVFSMARNHINKVNGTVKWPENIKLQELDLSYNQMEYLSPNAFVGIHTMRRLFLSSNRLSLMATTPEFSELFQSFPLLEHLSLAENGLSYIPANMFVRNPQLKVLDLSGNILTSVAFHTTQFKTLTVLDLSGNMIYTLDAGSRTRLDHLLTTHGTNIDIADNPLKCTCTNVETIAWVIAFQKRNSGGIINKCEFEGNEINIDVKAFDKSKYKCYETPIMIASILTSVASIAIISLLTFITVRIYKKHQVKDAVKIFIKDYKDRRISESFIAMISYSSQDGDVVLDVIYPNLEHHLRERVKLEGDIVCIDDKHFTPGRSIIEEMMNNIKDSCVCIFAVSNSFCESHWCRMEVEEAFERRKPIILIFLEEVNQAVMPDHVRDIFERYTRAKLVRDIDTHYMLKPSWPLLCDSVLELASSNCNRHKKAPCAIV